MINTKNISLSELLRDFNAGMGKYAGEDCPPGMVCDTAAAPAGKEALCPDCMSNPCICEEPEGSDPDDMVQAAVQAKAKQDEAVDAAKELRDMADAYIEDHDKAIAKEAEVFGTLFAKSACEAMQRYSEPVQVNNSMPADYPMFKQACDTAYAYTMNKLAEGELPAAADDSADEEDESDLAEAVRDAAAAARALAEHKAKKAKEKEKERASDDERAEAAQGAYDEAMAQMQGGAPATPEEQAAAAQGAYNEAMAQMQPAPAPAPVDAQAAASQNAYDQAMAQMQAQQDPQAAAAQNGYNQAMAQMQPQQ